MSSYVLKTRFESQLSRMNCHMFSTGLSSGDLGVQQGDVIGHLEMCAILTIRMA